MQTGLRPRSLRGVRIAGATPLVSTRPGLRRSSKSQIAQFRQGRTRLHLQLAAVPSGTALRPGLRRRSRLVLNAATACGSYRPGMAAGEDYDDYLGKSASAGRMGKAVEYLIAAACILSTRGELNVSTSMVDDEGVDLVFHRRDRSATLAVQVKARMSDSKSVQSDSMVAFVRSQTFRPRADLDMLFAAVDIARGAIMTAWLIPSGEFAAVLGRPDTRGRFRFVASMKKGAQDRWVHHRFEAEELAPAILARLDDLQASGRTPQDPHVRDGVADHAQI